MDEHPNREIWLKRTNIAGMMMKHMFSSKYCNRSIEGILFTTKMAAVNREMLKKWKCFL